MKQIQKEARMHAYYVGVVGHLMRNLSKCWWNLPEIWQAYRGLCLQMRRQLAEHWILCNSRANCDMFWSEWQVVVCRIVLYSSRRSSQRLELSEVGICGKTCWKTSQYLLLISYYISIHCAHSFCTYSRRRYSSYLSHFHFNRCLQMFLRLVKVLINLVVNMSHLQHISTAKASKGRQG